MSSAVRMDAHGRPHARLNGWLMRYERATRGAEVTNDTTLRFDTKSVVQPDAMLRILPDRGGASHPAADGYLDGAPELIVEIAASSASRDLHSKKDLYQAQGVREYLVWRTLDAAVDWFVNTGDTFEPLAPDADGCLHSRVFPGLVLDVPALLGNDDERVLQRLEQELGKGAHAEFVARLQQPRP